MNYKMPAEWEPHEATWLAWPHNHETWPGKFEKIPMVFVEFVKALHECEKVNILVNNDSMKEEAEQMLKRAGAWSANVNFYKIPTNDAWIRDYGPIFIKNDSGIAITDWIFNVWGERWEKSRPLDDAVPKEIAEKFGYKVFEPGIVLEGGSIDVNGEGTLLTTESCLLNKTRNPHLSRGQIEDYLRDYLGATNVIWLKQGIFGDDTSGHIDDIARFINPNTIVCAVEENPKNENYEITCQNFEILEKARDQNGNLLNIIKIPIPIPIPGPREEGYKDKWLPLSYVNFYIANSAVLLPVFGQPMDETVIKIFQALFPKRKIIGIYSSDLVWGLGGIHCVTQQQPY